MPICKKCGVDHALAASEGAHFEVEIRGGSTLVEVSIKALLPVAELKKKYGQDTGAYGEAITTQVPDLIRKLSGLPENGVEHVTHQHGTIDSNGKRTVHSTKNYERKTGGAPEGIGELLQAMGLPAGTDVQVIRSPAELRELLDAVERPLLPKDIN